MTIVPNVVHFIYPCWELTRPLSFLNYMAVKMVHDVQKPDEIKFWIDGEPKPSQWWDAIQPLVTVEHVSFDHSFGGTEIIWPQYVSDVYRLQILKKHGGIYMDTDMLLLLPLHEWMNKKLVMAWEPSGDVSICNALIISPPDNPFIDLWLERLPQALKSNVWANGGVNLPAEITKSHGFTTREFSEIIHSQFFCPLDLFRNWLFSTDPQIIKEAEDRTRFSYSIHGFETYWREIVKDITPQWCKDNDSLFSRIVRVYG